MARKRTLTRLLTRLRLLKYHEIQRSFFYHIYNRGAHREKIFYENDNYRYLESIMMKYSQQTQVIVAAYCLMPNHYHIIANQKPSVSLSSFLKKTFSAYTQAMNKRYGASGTLFQG